MKINYDPEADSIYIYLSDKAYSYNEELMIDCNVDYDNDNNPRGIEILDVTRWVENIDKVMSTKGGDAL